MNDSVNQLPPPRWRHDKDKVSSESDGWGARMDGRLTPFACVPNHDHRTKRLPKVTSAEAGNVDEVCNPTAAMPIIMTNPLPLEPLCRGVVRNPSMPECNISWQLALRARR